MKKMNLGAADTPKENVITLYHGSPNKVVTPTYRLGEDKHDYGRGFYLTPEAELAKEWAISTHPQRGGWLHTYTLDCSDLKILDFESFSKNKALYWVAELLRHREPDEFSRDRNYDVYRKYLLKQFDVDSEKYDVVRGWRADDSYFKIVTRFLSDGLAVPLLEEALRLGTLGVQYCCRSQAAFEALEPCGEAVSVGAKYAQLYVDRDSAGRAAFQELCDSPANSVLSDRVVLSTLIKAYLRAGGKL